MSKFDKSIHNICIASIKRSTIQPYEFEWTKLYDSNSVFTDSYPSISIDILENELIICSTIIDLDNFSILTTRRLLTMENGNLDSGNLIHATDKFYGDFKEYKGCSFTFGLIQLQNGKDFKYFIEAGKASMIMIHGVRTFIKLENMTNIQVNKVTKIWNRRTDDEAKKQ